MGQAADTATELIPEHDGMEEAMQQLLDAYEREGLCPRRLGIVRYHLESAFLHLNRAVRGDKPRSRLLAPDLELATQ